MGWKSVIAILTILLDSVGVLAAVYFIGGVFYNYKMYNARGLDLLPHRGKKLTFMTNENKLTSALNRFLA